MDTSKIFHSGIGMVAKHDGNATVKNVHEISLKTRDFLDKILNSSTEEITSFLNDKASLISQKDSFVLYRYGDFLLCRSSGETSLQLEKNLESLKNNLIAPKFAKFFELGQNDFLSVLEISPKSVISYKNVASKVSDVAKQKFKSGLQKLNSNGIINRKVFSDRDLYFVTKDNKDIVFADWSELSFISPEEQIQISEKLKNWQL